jgi:hypothetical protein
MNRVKGKRETEDHAPPPPKEKKIILIELRKRLNQ